jgi:hypothetical protein
MAFSPNRLLILAAPDAHVDLLTAIGQATSGLRI